jgi:uncharacterized protein YecE (DUF72 family)
VLDGFLADLAAAAGSHPGLDFRWAMEFRHPSFDTDEVRSKLAATGVALCVADTEEQPGRFVHTADFAYVRLRGTGYEKKTLQKWESSFRSAREQGVDVYCYLKHEDSAAGPRDAAILQQLSEIPGDNPGPPGA